MSRFRVEGEQSESPQRHRDTENLNQNTRRFGLWRFCHSISVPLCLCGEFQRCILPELRETPVAQSVAIVTGCSSGIGMFSALELARNGHRVVATMRNLAKRTQLDELAKQGGIDRNIEVRKLDVTDFPSIRPR